MCNSLSQVIISSNTPSSLAFKLCSHHHFNSSHFSQLCKFLRPKSFSEHVKNPLLTFTIFKLYSAILDLLSNKVILDINMLPCPWNCGFLAIGIADWLSSKTTIASVDSPIRSLVNCLIQTTSCAALASAMYSVSAVDKTTHDCFLLLQLTAVPLIRKMYLIYNCDHLDLLPNRHLKNQ